MPITGSLAGNITCYVNVQKDPPSSIYFADRWCYNCAIRAPARKNVREIPSPSASNIYAPVNLKYATQASVLPHCRFATLSFSLSLSRSLSLSFSLSLSLSLYLCINRHFVPFCLEKQTNTMYISICIIFYRNSLLCMETTYSRPNIPHTCLLENV